MSQRQRTPYLRHMHRRGRWEIERLESRSVLAAEPMITEFMAANDATLVDGHGAMSDWIELYNAGDAAANLQGWYLTDDPQKLTKWQFPPTELGASQFLIVHASGLGTATYLRDELGRLHTNFQLQRENGYLALVQPDGETIVSEFGPNYAEQVGDIGYGPAMQSSSTTLVDAHSPASLHVPTDSRWGDQWTQPDFQPDSTWKTTTSTAQPITAAIGYQDGAPDPRLVAYWSLDEPAGTQGTLSVVDSISQLNGTPFGTVSFGTLGANTDTRTALSGSGTNGGVQVPYDARLQQSSFTAMLWTRPHRNSGIHAAISSRSSVSGQLRGYSLLNSSGRWQFQTGDGASWDTLTGPLVVPNQWIHLAVTFDAQTNTKRIFVNGQQVTSTTSQQYVPQVGRPLFIGAGEDLGTNLFFDGEIDDVAYFRESLNASAIHELFNDGLSQNGTALLPHITSDVGAMLRGVNSAGYLRIPFALANPDAINQLILGMKYDDGYVAYLNGTEVARRNAPTLVSWNSAATASRNDTQAVTREAIDLSSSVGLLQPGTNILAIQALNVSTFDNDILLSAELNATTISIGQLGTGYLSPPTPGSINVATTKMRIPEQVTFSRGSGTLANNVAVELTTTSQLGVIRYTVDGSIPTDSSLIYTDPIVVDRSLQLRARLFAPDRLPGPITSASYIRLAPDVQSFSSNLPIMVIDNFGAGAIPNAGWNQTNAGIQQVARQAAGMMLFDTVDGTTQLARQPNLSTRAGVRVRGAFSSTFPQPGYSVETWHDDRDAGNAQALLGLAADADWVLYAPNPAYDETLIDNAFLFEVSRRMGHWAPNVRYVEAFVNTDGGAVTMADYVGLYVITEKVKRTDARLDFDPLHPDGNSGGWLLDINRLDPISETGELPKNFHTAGPDGILQTPRDLHNSSSIGDDIPRQYNAYINYDDPKGADITESQRDAIDAWFREMENILYNRVPNVPWNDPVRGYAKYIDVRNFIDYFILNNLPRNGDGLLISLWLYNPDPAAGGKLRFGPIWDVDLSSYSGDPTTELFRRADQLWYPRLFEDPNFRQAYVDRWQELRAGLLSDLHMSSIIDDWFSSIGTAAPARDGVTNWSGRLANMKSWLSSRAAAIDGTFVAPPVFAHPGGTVPPNFAATVVADEGDIIYTLDGSDPRLPGGAVSPSAQSLGIERSTLVPLGAPASAIVPNAAFNTAVGTAWNQLGFVEGLVGDVWQQGSTGVGYDTDPTYRPLLGIDLGDVDSSAYVRIPFAVAGTIGNGASMTLRMQFDDGFVAYLNGAEVARANAPGVAGQPVPFNATSTANHEAGVGAFDEFDLSPFVSLLRTGTNILAFHALNVNAGSSDMLLRPELVVSRPISQGIVLNTSTTITARTRSGESWSRPVTVTYLIDAVPVSLGDIVISEINYNPPVPTAFELANLPGVVSSDFEFLELHNISQRRVDLAGARIVEGVQFSFPQFELGLNERVVIARNPAALRLRYDNIQSLSILGPFTSGQLDNGGERIKLQTAANGILAEVDYDDGRLWSAAADGVGGTLDWFGTTVDASGGQQGATNWRGSIAWGGTPGEAPHNSIGVVINEVRSRSAVAAVTQDAIELLNINNYSVDISGWYLSDSASSLLKYAVPAGTVLAPGEFRIFDEDDFNPTPSNPLPHHFALDGDNGDDVWVVRPLSDGTVELFVDHVHFAGTRGDETWGRPSPAVELLIPQSRQTIGCINQDPRVGPIVISELNIAPAAPSALALAIAPRLTEDDLEYIELHNPTLSTVDLSMWELSGDISMQLPAGTNLPSGETLVILSFNPLDPANMARTTAFRQQYGLASNAHLIGGYSNRLNDFGGLVELRRAVPAANGQPPHLATEDMVITQPSTQNSHAALHRRTPLAVGARPQSWLATQPSPGDVQFPGSLRGDANGDGRLNLSDIDAMADAIHAARDVALLDLDNDRQVSWSDFQTLYSQELGLVAGDANGDHQVDAADLGVWDANRFQACRSSWRDGDWNGDRVVDGSDWNIWQNEKDIKDQKDIKERRDQKDIRDIGRVGRLVPRAPG